MAKLYCAYCGRVAHRCQCDTPNSDLHLFFARNPNAPDDYFPNWMATPYKRGVPPQIKRKERYQLRKQYDEWYQALAERDGEYCRNCGESDHNKLVIDHIISIAKGGTSQLENLQILCAECNRIKGKLCIHCCSDKI